MAYWQELIAAAVPLGIALITAFACYLYWDVLGLRRAASFMQTAVKQLIILPSCRMENLGNLQDVFGKCRFEGLVSSHRRFQNDSRILLKNTLAPDPAQYFDYSVAIAPYSGRGVASSLPFLLGGLGALTAALPFAVTLWERRLSFSYTVLYSLAGAAAMIALITVFHLLDKASENRAKRAAAALVQAVGACLPTARSATEAALLREAVDRSGANFQSAADAITKKMDDFAMESVVPRVAALFDESIQRNIAPVLNELNYTTAALSQALVQQQEQGMRELADHFARSIDGSLKDSVGAMAVQVSEIARSVETVKDGLDHSYERALDVLNESRISVEQAARSLQTSQNLHDSALQAIGQFNSGMSDLYSVANLLSERAKEAIGNLDAFAGNSNAFIDACRISMSGAISVLKEDILQMEQRLSGSSQLLMEKSEEMGENLLRVSQSMARTLEAAADSVSKGFGDAMISNADTVSKLYDAIEEIRKVGSDQYTKAAEAASGLLQRITEEMNTAMSGVGRDIAAGISEASLSSAQVVEKLSERMAQLKNEYDEYFARMDGSTQKTVDDMNFRAENLLRLFSEKTAEILDRLGTSLDGTMNRFESTSREMMQSYDEQARSIGLYAKELDLNVSDLSTSLKGSVEQFSDQLHASVERTFDDFDSGMAEISTRLANTVASIRESVELLPQVLSQK